MAGCGGSKRDAAQARSSALQELRARNAAASSVRLYESLGEVLPNVAYGETEESAAPLVQEVVVGEITEVKAGAGWRSLPSEPGGEGSERIAFEDQRAIWKTVHMTFRTTEDLAAGPGTHDIQVGLAINGGGDSEQVMRGLRSLGRVVLFLEPEPSPVFAYRPGLRAISGNGALLATIGTDGTLSLPAFESEEASRLLRGSRTLDQLRAQVRKPRATIRLQRLGGRPQAPLTRAPGQPCARCE